MLVCLDTETTDRAPGQICQLSYIIMNNTGAVKAVNKFFTVERVSPGAEAVHGFSAEMLRQLSEGTVFADHSTDILCDFKGNSIAAHNAPFDARFISHELSKVGISYFCEPQFCTMKFFTDVIKLPGKYGKPKWPTLQEVLTYLDISSGVVSSWSDKLFGPSNASAHDARFDATAVFLMMSTLVKSGVVTISD